MPLGQFSEKVLEMAKEYSFEYKNDSRVIRTEPTISTLLWKKAAIWAKDCNIPTIKINENATEMWFYAPSTKWLESSKPFDMDSVDKLLTMEWKTFDQYVELGHCMFYTVKVAKSKEEWHLYSQCDCPDFFKQYVCKHSIGIALRRKIATLPKIAIPTVLGQNKKSGRPAKATKALLVQ